MIRLRRDKGNVKEMDGEFRIGRLQRLGRERQARDLQDGHERGLWFCEAAADHAVAFIERYTVHTKGKMRGKPFILSAWERDEVIRVLFGWMRLPDGVTAAAASAMTRGQRRAAGIFRRFQTAYIQIAKKNGKSTLAAAVLLYLLVADMEGGAEVYSAAMKRDQAKLVFSVAAEMVQLSPTLRQWLGVYKTAIAFPRLGGTFQPLASEARSLDGLNIHGLSADELHEWPRNLWNVLKYGGAAREQPLIFAITTAGDNEFSVCYDQYHWGRQILEGAAEDDSFFVFIAQLDVVEVVADDPKAGGVIRDPLTGEVVAETDEAGDDWTDPENWSKANPNLGESVDLASMVAEYKSCLGKPAEMAGFKKLRLNMWIRGSEMWMEMSRWNRCNGEIDEAALAGRACYLGLDLSQRNDLTAMVAVFPPTATDELWRTRCWAWAPEEGIQRRSEMDRVPYDLWVEQGLLVATPGDWVDYSYMQDAIRSALVTYDVREICYDPYNATKMITDMQEEGIKNFVEIRQGAQTLSGPVKELQGLVLQEKLAHGGHPILRWCMGNVRMKRDRNANYLPDKEKSTERIDLVSALVTAMARAVVYQGGRRAFSADEYVSA